jgi:hypothetical protein
MNGSKAIRLVTLGVIGLGASALTITIFLAPDLGVGVLAGLVAARLVMGAVRWGAVFYFGKRWFTSLVQRPTLAVA